MFNNIIVGVDGRQGGRDAITLARRLAAPNATITLAHVYPTRIAPGRPRVRGIWDQLSTLERERDAVGIDAGFAAVGGATVGAALKQLAERSDADLVVVGSCHRGPVGRVLLGDDARSAVTRAPCAVAVVPAGYEAPAEISKIGVGYDRSPQATEALELAREVARTHGARVLARAVVSLGDIPYREPVPEDWPKAALQLMNDRQLAIKLLGDVEADATYGDPGEQLAQFSQDVDLLLIGSRGYGPVDSMFEESCSRYLARHSSCPLIVVPGPTGAQHTTAGAGASKPTIVVGYDGSDAARAALEAAALEATPDGRVVIVNAYELPATGLDWPTYGRRLSEQHDAGLALLDELPLGVAPLVGPRYDLELLGGDPARVLAAVAKVQDADRVLVGGGDGGAVARRLRELIDRPVRAVAARPRVVHSSQ